MILGFRCFWPVLFQWFLILLHQFRSHLGKLRHCALILKNFAHYTLSNLFIFGRFNIGLRLLGWFLFQKFSRIYTQDPRKLFQITRENSQKNFWTQSDGINPCLTEIKIQLFGHNWPFRMKTTKHSKTAQISMEFKVVRFSNCAPVPWFPSSASGCLIAAVLLNDRFGLRWIWIAQRCRLKDVQFNDLGLKCAVFKGRGRVSLYWLLFGALFAQHQ